MSTETKPRGKQTYLKIVSSEIREAVAAYLNGVASGDPMTDLLDLIQNSSASVEKRFWKLVDAENNKQEIAKAKLKKDVAKTVRHIKKNVNYYSGLILKALENDNLQEAIEWANEMAPLGYLVAGDLENFSQVVDK